MGKNTVPLRAEPVPKARGISNSPGAESYKPGWKAGAGVCPPGQDRSLFYSIHNRPRSGPCFGADPNFPGRATGQRKGRALVLNRELLLSNSAL